MGDNLAPDMTSQLPPRQTSDGGLLSAGEQDHHHHHHHHHHHPTPSSPHPVPPHGFSSLPNGGLVIPNGFCSRKDHATLSEPLPDVEASSRQAKKPERGESDSMTALNSSAAATWCGFEDEIAAAAATTRQGQEGCSCLLVDTPAGGCPAERRTDRSSPNYEAPSGGGIGVRGGDSSKDGGGDDDLSTDVCSAAVSVTPASSQDKTRGLSDAVQHSQEIASLSSRDLHNGQLPNHKQTAITWTEPKPTLGTPANAQAAAAAAAAAASTLQNASLGTSDQLIMTSQTSDLITTPRTVDSQDNPVVASHDTAQPNPAVDDNIPTSGGEHHDEEEVQVHDEDHEEYEEVVEEEERDPEEDEEHVPVRRQAADVDRGWAWVVLVAAFLGMTIFGTFTFSIGIFQAEILQVLEPDIQKTSWVGATHFSTLCMMGPFAGLIKNKLGSRKTVLLSSLIICLGMIAASLSVNVIQIILTYGVITGIGTGMALNPMFICVSFYFERYRGFASGVIAAGAGAGMFVGGPIIRQLIETYGLSGTFLIWGAVGLNIGVAGMVMRPSSLERRKERQSAMEEEVVVERMGWMDSGMLASVSTLPSVGGYWGSVLGLSSVIVRERAEGDSLTLQRSQNLVEMQNIQDALRSHSELSALSPEAMETAIRSTWRARNFKSSQLSVGDSLDSTSTGRRRFSPLLFRRDSRPEDLEKGKDGEECSLQQDGGGTFKSACQGSCVACVDLFRILANPCFALYMLSGSLWIFGETVVYAYLPTYAQTQGTSPLRSATLITALGFTSTFSRLVVGFVASHPSIGPELMHISMLGLCGIFTLTFPLYSSTFSGQLTFAALYGLYAGGLSSVINIVIISLMGVQHIALAFGLICFGQGVASLAGPTISGAIVHAGGTYDDVFLFSGALLLIAGFFGCIMVLSKPHAPPSQPAPEEEEEEEGDVGEEELETNGPVRIRMKGHNSYT